MTVTLQHGPAGAEAARSVVPASMPTYLVATDGTRESDDAILLARSLASGAGAQLQTISICDAPSVNDMPPFFPSMYGFEDPQMVRTHRRTSVMDQLLRVLGPGHGVLATVRSGNVGGTIALYAREVGCQLLVTGRGRHGVVERLLGEEHGLRLLRATPCPVLMAESSLREPPRRVVIGLDFSKRDQAAATAALGAMAMDAKVFLAHVRPDMSVAVPMNGPAVASYDEALRVGVEEMRAELAIPAVHQAETVVLHGHPGKALADFARRADADLLVVGIHGMGFLHRLVIGSTTAYLLRAAPCSLLASPAQ